MRTTLQRTHRDVGNWECRPPDLLIENRAVLKFAQARDSAVQLCQFCDLGVDVDQCWKIVSKTGESSKTEVNLSTVSNRRTPCEGLDVDAPLNPMISIAFSA